MRQAHRIIVNVLSNYGRVAVEITAALIVLPIVTRGLGKEMFGVAALLLSVFGIFQRIAEACGRGLQRYLPKAIAHEDHERVAKLLNTTVAGYYLVGFAGLAITLSMQDWLLGGEKIPTEYVSDVNLAYWGLAGWLALGFPVFAYRRGIEALQRFDLDGINVSFSIGFRSLVLIVGFLAGYASVSFYIFAQLGAWLMAGLLGRRCLLKLLPTVHESFRAIDRHIGRELAFFAGGSLLIILGNLMGTMGFRIFVGRRLGWEELGGLAAVLTVATLITRLVSNATSVLVPAVSSLESETASRNIAQLLRTASKYTVVVATALTVVPSPVLSGLFEFWLGDEFAGMGTLIAIVLIAHVPIALGHPGQQMLVGLGKLRYSATLMLTRGGGALGLAIAYVELVGPEVSGAAACVYGVLALGSLEVFLYSCRVCGVPQFAALFESLVLPILVGLVAAGLTWLVSVQLGGAAIWKLLLSATTGILLYGILASFVVLSGEERRHLRSFASMAWAKILETVRRQRKRFAV